MADENLAPDAAQAPAGSPSPDPNDASPAASVPADAAPEPAVGSEAPANGATPESPPEVDAIPATERKPKPDRIKELIAERNFWRERAVASTPAKPAEPAPSDVPEAPPTLEQHGHDVEAWSKAFATYHEARAAKVVEQHLARVEETRQARTIAQTFVEREASFAESTPDYAEAVADTSLQQYVTPTISEVIVQSEIGPQLSYHLATHRDELAVIAKMRPAQQAAALGRLEAKLPRAPAKPATPAPKPKTVQQTRAPAPPSPVGGRGNPSINLETCTIDQYMAARLGKRS